MIDLAGIRNSLGIIAGHNQGVRIEGIRFTNMNNNHFIEMDANANSVIRNNEFLGATGNTRMSAEAVNLDTPDAADRRVRLDLEQPRPHPERRTSWSRATCSPTWSVAWARTTSPAGSTTRGSPSRATSSSNMRNDAIRVMNWRDSAIIGNTFDGVLVPDPRQRLPRDPGQRRGEPDGAEQRLREHGPRDAVHAVGERRAGGRLRVTYNALTDNNLLDLASNIAGPGLQRPEAIINPEFRVFWPAGIVRFSGF